MKKSLFYFFIMILISSSLFAKQGICLDDNVRIRSKPTVTDSSIVGKLNKNEVFEIYGYEGSGKYSDGYLDFWACISFDKSKWVNAYWIATFPISYIEEDYEGFEHHWVLTDFDKSQDKYELIEMPSLQTIRIDKNYLGFTLNDARQNFLLSCVEDWLCIKSITPNANPETNYNKERISLDKNSSALFLQYDQEVFLSSFEINDASVKGLYGITIGMERKTLESIFGPLKTSRKDNSFYYCQELAGTAKYLNFYFENGKISKIFFELEI